MLGAMPEEMAVVEVLALDLPPFDRLFTTRNAHAEASNPRGLAVVFVVVQG